MKGTRFTVEFDYQEHDALTATNRMHLQTSRSRRIKNTYAPRILKRGETLGYSNMVSQPNKFFKNDNPQSQDFIEVRHEIQQRREQMQKILLQMKVFPTVPKTCMCRDQQGHWKNKYRESPRLL